MSLTASSVILLKHASVALCGAIVHATADLMKEPKSTISRSALYWAGSLVVAWGSGSIFALFALHYLGESTLTYGLAGVGGVLGEKGTKMIVSVLKKSIEANVR